MRILVLDEEFPFPLNSGKRIRSFQIWSRIAKSCDVTYLAYGSAQGESATRLREAGITTVAVEHELPAQSGAPLYLRLLRNIFSGQPATVDRHFTHTFLATCVSTFTDYRPDLLVCEWTPYVRFAEGMPSQRIVMVAHNVEATVWWRYTKQVAPGPKRWYLGLQARRMERFERWAATRADGIIAVSDDEASQLRVWSPRASIATVENGVDVTYFVPASVPDDRDRLVFSGAMDWRPNQHAVRYFVQSILPIIRRTHPDVTFTIVGRNPSNEVVRLAETPGVEVTGTVSDIRPYLGAATVFVVPLLIGGGSRLKILEALAMALPVVSTTVGAEGLRLVEGKHVFRADGEMSFARRVCTLLDDRRLRADMGQEGRRLVEESYHWDGLADKQLKFMLSLCTPP